jgi:hypothetical protein
VQRLDEPAVGAQQALGLGSGRIAPDHRLAAAQVETGQRVLVRHPAGQLEHVGEGVVLALVRIEPGAAERRPEGRRIDADDRLEAGLPVLAEDDLFVPAGVGAVGVEHTHRCSPDLVSRPL